MKPLVSICIPNYNSEKYIAETIKSALNQTYRNTEIIIIDNASNDNSWKIIKSFRDRRIKAHRNKRNLGYTHNLNRCITKTKGKYVKVLHADDILEKHVVEKQLEILEKNSNVGFVYGAVILINKDGARTGIFDTDKKDMIISGKTKLLQLLKGNHVMFPSVMIRRTCLEEAGFFEHDIPYCNDWYMWMYTCLRYDAAYMKEITAQYRIHETSGGHLYNKSKISGTQKLACMNKIFSKIKDKNILKNKKHVYYLLAREQIIHSLDLIQKGYAIHARRNLTVAMKISSNWKIRLAASLSYPVSYLGKGPASFIMKVGKSCIRQH